MSSTVVMTMATPPPPTLRADAACCCPSCGHDLPPVDRTQADLLGARSRIADLEAQVRLLNEKASAAVDRLADNEDEVARLRAEARATATTAKTGREGVSSHTDPEKTGEAGVGEAEHTAAAALAQQSSPRTSFLQASTNRLSQLLTRKSTPNLRTTSSDSLPPTTPTLPPQQQQQHQTSPSNSTATATATASTSAPPRPISSASSTAPPPPPKDFLLGALATSAVAAAVSSPYGRPEDLLRALTREKSLRKQAEGRLTATSREIEELSVSLFEQANEMVADERRARARLEQRVGELERRDMEKRGRLERLEGAMGRIQRVRALLDDE